LNSKENDRMGRLFSLVANMNLLLWLLGVLLFHGLLYLILGTENWLGVTLAASAVWAVVLIAIKALAKSIQKENAD
jgi:uncharacterized membrane protein